MSLEDLVLDQGLEAEAEVVLEGHGLADLQGQDHQEVPGQDHGQDQQANTHGVRLVVMIRVDISMVTKILDMEQTGEQVLLEVQDNMELKLDFPRKLLD